MIPRKRKAANNQCSCGKFLYGRKGTAEAAIEAMKRKGSFGLYSYRCSETNGYHIGHSVREVWRIFKILEDIKVSTAVGCQS